MMLMYEVNCPDKKSIKPVTKSGSNWNNGSNAGSFYWNVNNTSSHRNRNISSQLLNAQKKVKSSSFLPCHLAKHKNTFELFW